MSGRQGARLTATGSWAACSHRIADAELRRLQTVPGLGPASSKSSPRSRRTQRTNKPTQSRRRANRKPNCTGSREQCRGPRPSREGTRPLLQGYRAARLQRCSAIRRSAERVAKVGRIRLVELPHFVKCCFKGYPSIFIGQKAYMGPRSRTSAHNEASSRPTSISLSHLDHKSLGSREKRLD